MLASFGLECGPARPVTVDGRVCRYSKTPIPHLPDCFPAGALLSGVLIKEMGGSKKLSFGYYPLASCVNSQSTIFTQKMAFKFAVLSVLLAVANAGIYSAPAAVEYHAPAVEYHAPAVEYHAAPAVAVSHGPVASTAVGSQTQSVYRSADGNHAVSTYTKAVDTAFSSVRKYDTRVSNDAVALAHAPVVAAAPAVATVAHAPAVATVAHAPVAYSAPVVAHAPAVATVAHAPAVATVAHAPAVAYAPSYATSYTPAVAKVAAPASVLGVAYSAAPAVAHLSYSNGYGINYHY